MWIIMMTGKKIFTLDENGKLIFRLSPILPAWLFKNRALSFKLLGSIDVEYLNKKKKNTFGRGVAPVAYKLIFEDKEEAEIKGAIVPEPFSKFIRDRQVKKLIVSLA
jgi:hypothetical protein